MKMLKMLFAAFAAVTMTLTAQAAKTAKAVVDDGGKTLRFVYDETDYGTKDADWFSVAEAEEISPYSVPPWIGRREFVNKVVFDSSFAAYKPRQCSRWFFHFSSLASVEGLANLDTSEATSFNCMFIGCESLESLDVAGFDTAQVTDMDCMFCNCSKLLQLDVSNFDTEQVRCMNSMFGYCSGLGMIVASEKFVAAPDGLDMFIGCEALEGGNGTVYDTSHTDGVYARIDKSGRPGYFTDVAQPHERYVVNFMENGGSEVIPRLVKPGGQVMRPADPIRYGFAFDGWYADSGLQTSYDFTAAVNADKTLYAKWVVSSLPAAKAVLEDGGATLRFVYDTNDYGEKDEDWFWLAEAEAAGPMTMPPWSYCSANVTKVVFADSFAAYRPKTCSSWFADFENLARIDGIANLNTSEVTDMSFMFSCCESLTSLDVSGFDTAKVTDMAAMFQRCLLLPALDVSGFNTANVTDMSAMFSWCNSLTTLDLSHFHTAKVKNMNALFNECQSLKSLDLSSFDTSEVTDMSWMFADCYALTSLVVTNFNAEKVADMSYMFMSCRQLAGLDVSNFDTAQVTNMESMFEECSSLKSLDLSGFDTANVSDFHLMFVACSALKTIIVSNKFVVDPSSESQNMFLGCTQLVGGSGTKFSYTHVDAEYARIDKPGQPGYFTDPTAPIEDVDFTVTFDSHGGSAVSPQKVKGGTQMVRPPNPTKSGYSFDGWYVDSGCQIPYDFSNAVNTDITLHAGWVLAYAARVVVEDGCATLRFVFDANDYGEEGIGWFSVAEAEKSGRYGSVPWSICAAKVTKVIFDTSFAKYLPSTCTRWFEGFEKLQTVEVLNNLKTVNVTDMYRMFYGCSSLATLDLSDLSTWSVTNMNTMFSGCSSLASLDLTGFDTAQVTDMGGMFYGCSSLSSLDVSDFVTTKVTDMSAMFDGCSSLTALDLSNFDTAQVKNLLWMFEDCSSLETIVASENFVVGQDLVHETMFSGCTKLVGARGTAYDPDHVDATYAHVDQLGQPGYFSDSMVSIVYTVTFVSNGGSAVAAQTVAAGGLAVRPNDPTREGFDFGGWYSDDGFKTEYDFATAVNANLTLYAKWNSPLAKAVIEDGGATLRFVFDMVNYGTKGTDWFSVADAEAIDPVSGFMPWAGCASSVTKVIFDSSFAGFKPRHCGGWFWYFSSLASVEGLENLDVSKATSLARMFMGCSSLTSLDLAGFDTSCVTDMRGMFYGCTSLKRIAVGDKFVTTSVTASDGMFYDCTSLKGGSGTAYSSEHVDAEYARIDGGTGAPGYFTIVMAKAVVQNDGKTLRFVYDGENYGTKDTDWFSVAEGETINPTSEDVPWYVKRTTVTKVVFDKSFAVYQPTSVASWFYNFTKLTSVEGVRYWDTSKAKNFYALFTRCSGLTTLDIAGLRTAGATSLESFFNGCTSLKTIYVDSNFVVSEGMNSNNMFKDCTSLVGGAGTVFDSGKTNREYAYIDYGTARPGYFTALELRGIAVGTPDGRLVFYYDSESHAREGDVYSVWSAETTYPSPWSGECARFTAVEFTTSFLGCHPTSLSFWFKGFSALEHVNGIANLDTSAASGMVSMFDGCARLTKLDLSGFDTRNVTQMNDMFKNCSSLGTIIAGEKFVTTALSQPSSDMFAGCTALVGGAGTTYDANHVDSVYARTDEPAAGSSAAVPGYFTRAVSARAVLADGGTTLRFVYDDAAYGAKGADWFSVAEAETVDPRSHYKEIPWYGIRKQIAKVVIDPSFRSYRPKQCGGWFYEFTNLTTIEGLANLATSEATSFCRMFASCRNLTELDLSGFETDSVEDAFQMFSTCSNLRTIIALESCTLSRANDSTSMFANCTSLVGGAGTTYDADHVDADYARIDGGATDPGYFTLTNRFYAVYDADASQLTFYYDAVKRGERVYESVRGSRPWRTRSSATGVVFDGSVAAYRPTSCSQWFSGFARLESVSGLDALDVSAVTVFADMFRRCLALRELDLSGFDTSSATSMSNMFADSTNLTTIIVSDGFTTANLRRAEPTMFKGCTALVGGAGTTYSPERVSSEYARIDGGPSSATPGYFTLNAAPSGGYAAWAMEKGLTGADAAWDAKPAMWGGTWENGFIYTYGEGLADGSLAIMNISFDANGEPVITTAPVVEGHTDFTSAVIGTPTLDEWSSPVILNRSGDDWTLPKGAAANFFRVRLTE